MVLNNKPNDINTFSVKTVETHAIVQIIIEIKCQSKGHDGLNISMKKLTLPIIHM